MKIYMTARCVINIVPSERWCICRSTHSSRTCYKDETSFMFSYIRQNCSSRWFDDIIRPLNLKNSLWYNTFHRRILLLLGYLESNPQEQEMKENLHIYAIPGTYLGTLGYCTSWRVQNHRDRSSCLAALLCMSSAWTWFPSRMKRCISTIRTTAACALNFNLPFKRNI